MLTWRRRFAHWGRCWYGHCSALLLYAELHLRRRLSRSLPLGTAGERLAEAHLLRQGMIVIARNVVSEWGELDLIAVDGSVVVFVEVKTRRAGELSDALAAVTPEKQRRLVRLAKAYLRRHELQDYPARFDVIAIAWSPDSSEPPELAHLRGAFEAAGDSTMS